MVHRKDLEPQKTQSEIRNPQSAIGTTEFELIPAIDIKDGKCVRLQEGKADQATEYGDDPVAMALKWAQEGATRLHVIDLDGAFSGQTAHSEIARSIFATARIPVQIGGGIRTLDQVERLLALGAARVIFGTAAIEHPDVVETAVRRHGNAIVVGIDARDGRVALRGWRTQSSVPAVDLARRMKAIGIERIIYTDIARDGMLYGVNLDETERLAREAQVSVIASGGVVGIQDVRDLWERRAGGIEGVILGRALYERKIDLRQATRALAAWNNQGRP
jgi:phosphoribosylformimino-5-aminoimidazole carboxamide ribotide isomerase